MLESGNVSGAFLQIPTPMLDKEIPGPMEARFLSSVGLGFGTRIGRTQLFPTPALDKNQFPIERVYKESPGPSGPGVQKVSETVSKQSPESRNRLFRTLFGPRGQKAPRDSCKGRPGLQGLQGKLTICLSIVYEFLLFPKRWSVNGILVGKEGLLQERQFSEDARAIR